MMLYERVRPRAFEAVVGQDKAVALLRRMGDAGHGGRAYWISGPTGVGKTTLARIVAASHCGESGVVELDSADDVDGGQLDNIDAALCFRPLWVERERRCWIINEAHGLRPSAIRRLLGIIERMGRDADGRVCLIFTTTNVAEEGVFGNQIDAGPLLGRCTYVRLTNQGLAKAGASLVRRVAMEHGLDGQPESAYVKLMQECGNSIRKALVRVEEGYMLAKEVSA